MTAAGAAAVSAAAFAISITGRGGPPRAGDHGLQRRRADRIRGSRRRHGAPAPLAVHPAVPRRLARALGGRHAGGRHHESHRPDQHRPQRQRATAQRQDEDHRALQARGQRRPPVPDHRGRSRHLREAVHRVAAAHAARRRHATPLRLSRGQLRRAAVDRRGARRGCGAGGGPRERDQSDAPAGAGRPRCGWPADW